jgi:hypothetical protein
MTEPKRGVLAVPAVLMLLASGCTDTAARSPSNSVNSATVEAAHGGKVSLPGAILDIPANALSADTTITATRIGAPTPPPGAARPAGEAVHIDLGTARLVQPISLTIPLRSKPATDDTIGLAYFDPTTQAWRAAPAHVDMAAGTISATVAHLSWWQPWTWDVSRLETTMSTLLQPVASFRAEPPYCKRAPPVVKLTITGGRAGDPALDGCVEAAGKDLRVTLVNNRSYATVVAAPREARQERMSRGGLFDALLQQVDQTRLGGYYLPPAAEVSYLVEGTGGDVHFNSAPNLLAFTITTAADFALVLAGNSPSSAATVTNAAITDTRVSGTELTEVGKCIGDSATADPPGSPVEAVRMSLQCLGILEPGYLAPLALLQTLIAPLAAAYDIGQDSAAGGSDAQAVLVRGLACPSNEQVTRAVQDQNGYWQAGDMIAAQSVLCAGPFVRAVVVSHTGDGNGGVLPQGYGVLLEQRSGRLIWLKNGSGPLCSTNRNATREGLVYVPNQYARAMDCIVE